MHHLDIKRKCRSIQGALNWILHRWKILPSNKLSVAVLMRLWRWRFIWICLRVHSISPLLMHSVMQRRRQDIMHRFRRIDFESTVILQPCLYALDSTALGFKVRSFNIFSLFFQFIILWFFTSLMLFLLFWISKCSFVHLFPC